MSDDSRKLRALLLASTGALEQSARRYLEYPDYYVQWSFPDVSEFLPPEYNIRGFVRITFNSPVAGVHYCNFVVNEDTVEKIRTFCNVIEDSEYALLFLEMLDEYGMVEIYMNYCNGMLFIDNVNTLGRDDYRAAHCIVAKTEILKLHTLVDEIEAKFFFYTR